MADVNEQTTSTTTASVTNTTTPTTNNSISNSTTPYSDVSTLNTMTPNSNDSPTLDSDINANSALVDDSALPDETIVSALATLRARSFVLGVEAQIVKFLEESGSSASTLEFVPMTSYHRLLLHRLADYFSLEHISIVQPDANRKIIMLKKNVQCDLPVKLNTFIPPRIQTTTFTTYNGTDSAHSSTDEQQAPKMKIMKRNKKCEQSTKVEPLTAETAALTLQRREEAYIKARAQLFQDDDEPVLSDDISDAVSPRWEQHVHEDDAELYARWSCVPRQAPLHQHYTGSLSHTTFANRQYWQTSTQQQQQQRQQQQQQQPLGPRVFGVYGATNEWFRGPSSTSYHHHHQTPSSHIRPILNENTYASSSSSSSLYSPQPPPLQRFVVDDAHFTPPSSSSSSSSLLSQNNDYRGVSPNNFAPHQNRNVSNCVLEVVGLPAGIPNFKADLLLEDLKALGCAVRWLDQSRIIAVFQSGEAAQNALQTFRDSRFQLQPQQHVATTMQQQQQQQQQHQHTSTQRL